MKIHVSKHGKLWRISPEGKFCGICNTKVYDLSEKSLEKIESDYINKDICVKMTEEQVDAFRYVHPVKRFAIAAFFIFGDFPFYNNLRARAR